MLVVSVHKKGAANEANNFRGIALMPVMAKVYAQLMLNRVEKWSNANRMRATAQAGFRKTHRIEDHTLIIKTISEVLQ